MRLFLIFCCFFTAILLLSPVRASQLQGIVVINNGLEIGFVYPTEDSGSIIHGNSINIDVAASSKRGDMENITIFLYNSTHSLINMASNANSSDRGVFRLSFESLSYGMYSFNATAFDSGYNSNSTETRNVTLAAAISGGTGGGGGGGGAKSGGSNGTLCIDEQTCGAWNTCVGGEQTRDCMGVCSKAHSTERRKCASLVPGLISIPLSKPEAVPGVPMKPSITGNVIAAVLLREQWIGIAGAAIIVLLIILMKRLKLKAEAEKRALHGIIKRRFKEVHRQICCLAFI